MDFDAFGGMWSIDLFCEDSICFEYIVLEDLILK